MNFCWQKSTLSWPPVPSLSNFIKPVLKIFINFVLPLKYNQIPKIVHPGNAVPQRGDFHPNHCFRHRHNFSANLSQSSGGDPDDDDLCDGLHVDVYDSYDNHDNSKGEINYLTNLILMMTFLSCCFVIDF